jgi:hypothetical protein
MMLDALLVIGEILNDALSVIGEILNDALLVFVGHVGLKLK